MIYRNNINKKPIKNDNEKLVFPKCYGWGRSPVWKRRWFGCLATVNSLTKYLYLVFDLEEYDYRKLNYEETMTFYKLDIPQVVSTQKQYTQLKNLMNNLRCRIRIGLYNLYKTSIEKIYLCNISVNSFYTEMRRSTTSRGEELQSCDGVYMGLGDTQNTGLKSEGVSTLFAIYSELTTTYNQRKGHIAPIWSTVYLIFTVGFLFCRWPRHELWRVLMTWQGRVNSPGSRIYIGCLYHTYHKYLI